MSTSLSLDPVPEYDWKAFEKELRDLSEAIGYGREAHPSNILQVLRERALR